MKTPVDQFPAGNEEETLELFNPELAGRIIVKDDHKTSDMSNEFAENRGL